MNKVDTYMVQLAVAHECIEEMAEAVEKAEKMRRYIRWLRLRQWERMEE